MKLENAMAGRLHDKVAIITGATSGIGEETARRFVAEGAKVLISGRNSEKGEALKRELGDSAIFYAADVTREADIATLVDVTMEHYGQLDCLFNNAGGPDRGTLTTITESDFDYSLRLLLGSVVFGIKHAARVMCPRAQGSIINNASIAAHRAGQGGYLYSAAKTAVSHVTRLAGLELGANGVRVNAISPGAIVTPIFWGGSARAQTLKVDENKIKKDKLERNLARATPMPRAGYPDDIASAAVFLASDDASFVNCHDLVVDGGRIAMFWERPNDV
jgi:NAD(P)-dependent dehydrogenase (short-subunit alcohol dehydrogenase family)